MVYISDIVNRQNNTSFRITALEYTGGVPYSIIKPIVDKATPEQLLRLEYYNPYLLDDTVKLWEMHCNRRFKKQTRREQESWRDMFMVRSTNVIIYNISLLS